MAPAAAYVGEFLATFEEFPPSQKPGSFTIGDAKEKILNSVGSK
jgi:arylsulfatase